VLDPEHAFALTRKTKADAEQLHGFLAERASAVH